MALINTAHETARRPWFPQGLAENNKILNIPPLCVMAGAFSAELASLKGKTTFRPWKNHPVSNNDHWSVLQVFLVFLRSTTEISDCHIQTKGYLKSFAWHKVFPRFLNLKLLWVKPKHRLEGGYICASRRLWFVSFEQWKSWGQWKHRGERTLGLCCYIHFSETSRPYDTACMATGNLLLSKHRPNTQGYYLHTPPEHFYCFW